MEAIYAFTSEESIMLCFEEVVSKQGFFAYTTQKLYLQGFLYWSSDVAK